MAAMEPLSNLFGISNVQKAKEDILLELDLFLKICDELKDTFRTQYKEYFRLMRFTIEKENIMLNKNLVRLILQDILLTGEYTMEGIAFYTNTHIDIIHEVAAGQNQNPSVELLRKILELHRVVRNDLYCKISKRIAEKYLSAS